MKKLSCLGLLGIVLGFLILIPVIAVLNGWILMVLWGWFVVPIFHLPSLSLFAAMGISLVAAYLSYQYINTKAPERTTREAIGHAIAEVVVRPITYLISGWIIHQLMVSNVLS